MRWLFSPYGTLKRLPFWAAMVLLTLLIPALIFGTAELTRQPMRFNANLTRPEPLAPFWVHLAGIALALIAWLSLIALMARRLRDAGWPPLWAFGLLISCAMPVVMIVVAESHALNQASALNLAYLAVFFAVFVPPALFVLVCALCLWPSIEQAP